MNLNESHLRKTDPILLDRLMHAKAGEVLRVAMTLNAEALEAEKTLTLPTLDPGQFPSRVDYRQALIQQQQARLETNLGATIQDLQDLSLKTYGGTTSRVIIIEGTAEQIIKSLDLTGVHHASFDQSIRIEPALPSQEMLKSAEYLTQVAIRILESQKGENILGQDLIRLNFKIFMGSNYNQKNNNVVDAQLISHAFEKYVENYKARYCLLKVLGMRKPVELESVYTDVRLLNDIDIHQFESLQEMEKAYRKQTNIQSKSSQRGGVDIANQQRFLMVLGAPGAGKSTFLRRIGLEALKGKNSLFEHSCIPILIELKQLNNISVDLSKLIVEEFESCDFPDAQEFVMAAIHQGKLLLLLDGLDEVPTSSLSEVVNEIINFVQNNPKNRYIFSCRTAAYRQEFRGFVNVKMAEFEDDQIQQFINNWFKSEVDQKANTAERCWNDLQQPEQQGAKELAHTPLLLTFLCLVYDRSQKFPINRSVLYSKALRILMEEWAADKRILQDAIYQGLSTDLEEILLSEIAATGFEANQMFFSKGKLIDRIRIFLANNLNAPNQLDGEAILNAIVVQQGILVERAEDAYSFSHLTLQEYLTAQYISDNSAIKHLVRVHLTDPRWQEVFLMVAGLMRGGVDELLLLMEDQAQKFISPSCKHDEDVLESSSNLQNLLQWADSVVMTSEEGSKLATKRSEAIFLALNLIYDYDRSIDRARNRALNLAIDLTSERDLAIDRARDRALNFAINLTTINNNLVNPDEKGIYMARNRAIANVQNYQKIKIFQPEIYTNLISSIESLQPDVVAGDQTFEFILRINSLWFEALHLEPDTLRFSQDERERLEKYLYSNELIVKCKKSAVLVSKQTWSMIEDRMFKVLTPLKT